MILVTGASGKVGSEAARLLVAQHQPTRALVRDASRAPRAEVEVVTGDFEHADTLDAAMRGIETVILVSPAVPAQEIAVIGRAARQGVRHIVKITSKASADSQSIADAARRRSRRIWRLQGSPTRCYGRTHTCKTSSPWLR
jgi:uncharacterized protein YbjT (DUF2867 family)